MPSPRAALAALVIAASAFAAALQPSALPGQEGRPHDPWVFRSVLDGNARMLTAALHDDLWVAYDTQTGSLYKAWRGGVKFDGAVYTARHGPQPTSEGEAYVIAPPDSPWRYAVRPDQEAEQAEIATPEAHYLGHAVEDGRLVIRTRLAAADGRTAVIAESPEFRETDGAVTLERRIRAEGDLVPDLVLLVPIGFLEREDAVLVAGVRDVTRRLTRPPQGLRNPAQAAQPIPLDPDDPVVIRMVFGTAAPSPAHEEDR